MGVLNRLPFQGLNCLNCPPYGSLLFPRNAENGENSKTGKKTIRPRARDTKGFLETVKLIKTVETVGASESLLKKTGRPKQQTLKFVPAAESKRKTKTAQACDYDRRNLESARLILADPDCRGGRESFAVIWARSVLERLGVAE